MNDVPRQKLADVVARYGPDILDDPRRVRALLMDLAGEYRREIFVLVSAQEEQVPQDLVQAHAALPLAVRISQLTRRLVQNRALAEEAARWAVESWALALGKPVAEFALPGDPAVLPTPRKTVVRQQPPPLSSQAAPVTEPAPIEPLPPAIPPAIPPGAPAGDRDTVRGVYASRWPVGVYGRPRSQPGGGWQHLGDTPGRVPVPLHLSLGLRARVASSQLAAWIAEIPHPGDVVSLHLSERLTDAGMAALPGLPNLSYLSVDNADGVTGAGMLYLARLPRLETLIFKWAVRVPEQGFAPLAQLVQLRYLDLAWGAVSDDGLRFLEALPLLVHIGLGECKRVTGAGLAHLRSSRNLRTLILTATACNDAGAGAVAAFWGLSKLELARCDHLTRRGIKALVPLKSLLHLDLGGNTQLGDRALDFLPGISCLTYLNLSRWSLSNGGLRELRALPYLEHLVLSGCERISDWGLRYLRGLEQLRLLNVEDCPRITERGVRRLERPGLSLVY